MNLLVKIPFLAALVFTGLLCGASLDQSFKQLPARHRTGMSVFSTYAKAADLKNGVWWYAILGIGSALTSLLTAMVVALKGDTSSAFSFLVFGAALFAIGQVICTSQAAPTYFRQKHATNEKELEVIFNRFERIQTIRSVCVVLNFAALIGALAYLF
jgi:Na+/melibiose symporter-like transporter